MSPTVYAIASGKGGVGKTTTAVNLGAALAADGHEVVVVDTDLGMANLAGFLEFDDSGATLHDVLAGEAEVDDAVYTAPGDLDVVPSSTDIEAFARAETANLGDVVAALRADFDYVLLDTGAGISHDTVLPLGLADEVILVSTPDVASVSDTAKTADLSERVGTTVAGAVLNKRSDNVLDADDVEETLGTAVLAVVPSDEAVPTSVDAGRPLSLFAPTSPAALVYDALAAVLTAEDPEDVLAGLDTADGPGTSDAVTSDSVPAAASERSEVEREPADASAAPDGSAADALDDGAVDPDGTDPEELLGLEPEADRRILDLGDDADPASAGREAPSETTESDGPLETADAARPDETAGADDPGATDADAAGTSPADGGADADPSVDAADAESLIEPAEEPADRSPPSTGSESDEGSSGAADIDPASVPFAADDADAETSTVLSGGDDTDSEDAEPDSNGGLVGKLTGLFSR